MESVYASKAKCWYDAVCQQPERLINPNEPCSKTKVCNRYLEMEYLMRTSGIPESRQKHLDLYPEDIDYDIFCELSDIKDNIVDNVECGINLYLCSTTPGNGKTSWAIKMMLKYFNDVWIGNGFRPRGLFIHVPTFLLKYKNFEVVDDEFEILKRLISTVDLVIWDDIGCTSISSYDLSLLTMYVDQRVLSERSNIYTGNLTSEIELARGLGERLKSRIWNTSNVFIFRGKDRRAVNGIVTDNI